MRDPSHAETLVVGAGQAGLAMSRHLGNGGRDHLVLERRNTLGGGWQDRWDSFRLVTPNWTASFPDHPYDGTDPGGFMTRDEIAGRVAGYAAAIRAPVALDTDVRRLAYEDGRGFRLETNRGEVRAKQVVVATSCYNVPRVPDVGHGLPSRITCLHSHEYRNETSLPAGAVLVVGSGQSGVQIAQELQQAGRSVYLSVGSAGRLPRRYRGRDIFDWLAALGREGPALGISLPTVETLPDPSLRLAGVPHLSGHGGGHETDLRRIAEAGMNLLGRIDRVHGERLQLGSDLLINLERADRSFDERMRPLIDRFIDGAGIAAPPDDRQPFHFTPPDPRELDLEAAQVSTVIWATGYRPDFSWVDLPILDDQGLPRHRRGVSDIPGLYFLGLIWQHTLASATLVGPILDGPYVAENMGLTIPQPFH